MKKLGLSILYTDIGKKNIEWKHIKDKEKTLYLREQYWAKCAENAGSRKNKDTCVTMSSAVRRHNINTPGDVFIYQIPIGSNNKKSDLTWFEIVEVFAYDNGEKINNAMKEWNDVTILKKEKFENLISEIDMTCPRKDKQKYVAQKVIETINKKIKKTSYNKIVSSIGKGHLVVGLPLWFATSPVKVMNEKNVSDDFMTIVYLALLKIKEKVLAGGNCPFYRITIIWDISVNAMEELLKKSDWNEGKSIKQSSLKKEIEEFINLLKLIENTLIENNIKEENIPSCPLCISIELTENKQSYSWQKNLEVISQNLDTEFIRAFEKIKK